MISLKAEYFMSYWTFCDIPLYTLQTQYPSHNGAYFSMQGIYVIAE